METIQEKYNRLRSHLKNGDEVLFYGIKPVSRVIKISDSCDITHVGIIVNVYGTLYIVDSNKEGVQPDRLSFRISQYKGGDFIIKRSLSSQEIVDLEVSKLLKETNYEIKYDFKNGIKSLINRSKVGKLLGIDFKIKTDKYHMICSEFCRKYAENLDMIYKTVIPNSLFFPQDYIRFEKFTTTLE